MSQKYKDRSGSGPNKGRSKHSGKRSDKPYGKQGGGRDSGRDRDAARPARSFDSRPAPTAAEDNRRHEIRKERKALMPQKGHYHIYGKHAAEAALKNTDRQIHQMFITQNTMESMPIVAEHKYLPHRVVTTDELNLLLKDDSVHQGIVLEVSPLADRALEDVPMPEGKGAVVILDQVSDPHNVGAVLRSAAAFGAVAVIVPEHNAVHETGVLAKAASGALERMPMITVTNLAACMKDLKSLGFWMIGLDGEATTDISAMPDYDKVALVMGAEGKGLRRLTAENCDLLVKIPISHEIESLNVSNAAAVALYAVSQVKR